MTKQPNSDVSLLFYFSALILGRIDPLSNRTRQTQFMYQCVRSSAAKCSDVYRYVALRAIIPPRVIILPRSNRCGVVPQSNVLDIVDHVIRVRRRRRLRSVARPLKDQDSAKAVTENKSLHCTHTVFLVGYSKGTPYLNAKQKVCITPNMVRDGTKALHRTNASAVVEPNLFVHALAIRGAFEWKYPNMFPLWNTIHMNMQNSVCLGIGNLFNYSIYHDVVKFS